MADEALEEWLSSVREQLGLTATAASTVEQSAVLDLARAAAHGVARPAAPLTTFFAGYALGMREASSPGQGPDAQTVLAQLAALADEWPSADGDG